MSGMTATRDVAASSMLTLTMRAKTLQKPRGISTAPVLIATTNGGLCTAGTMATRTRVQIAIPDLNLSPPSPSPPTRL